MALLAGTVTLRAEAPENRSNRTRTKPQIIYHLPPASPYAERLHSQAKVQNNELPTDGSTNANAHTAATPQLSASPLPSQHTVKPRIRSSRPQSRPHSVARPSSHGNGNGHGNHSHKK